MSEPVESSMRSKLLRLITITSLVLLVTSCLLWLFSPTLLPKAVRLMLADRDMQLVTIKLSRPTGYPITIDELQLQAGDSELLLKGLALTPVSFWSGQWQLTLADLQWQGALAPTPTEPDEMLGPLLAELLSLVDRLPTAGNIGHFQLCADSCLRGALDWQRDNSQLNARLIDTTFGTVSQMTLEGRRLDFQLAWDSAGSARYSAEYPEHMEYMEYMKYLDYLPPALTIEGQAQLSAENVLSATAELQSMPYPEALSIPLDDGYLLTLQPAASRLALSLSLPANTRPEPALIWQQASFQADLMSQPNLRLDLAEQGASESALLNDSAIMLQMTQRDATLRLQLGQDANLILRDPRLADGLIRLEKGAYCQLTPALACSASQLDVTGTFPDTALGPAKGQLRLRDLSLSGEKASWLATAAGHIRAAIDDQDLLNAEGTLNLSPSGLQAISSKVKLASTVTGSVALTHSLALNAGQLTGEFELALPEGLARLGLAWPGLAQLDDLQISNGQASGRVRLGWNLTAPGWIETFDTDVQLKDLQARYADYQLAGLNLDLATTGWPVLQTRVPAGLTLERGYFGRAVRQLAADIEGSLDITRQQLQLTISQLTLTPAASQDASDVAPMLPLSVKSLEVGHNLTSASGHLQARFDVPLRNAVTALDSPSLAALRIDAGNVAGTARLAWNLHDVGDIREFETDLTMRNLQFGYDGYQIAGLNVTTQLAGWPVITTRSPVMLTLQELNFGVPLTQLNASLALRLATDLGQLEIKGQQLEASILGGRIHSQQFDFSTDDSSGSMLLDLEALQLQQLLDPGRDDFNSSGLLDGSVPVQVTAGKVSVKQGRLEARQPGGFIRYTPEQATRDMLQGSEQTRIVLDSLSDFQYDRLVVDFDYSSTDALVARVNMQGKNPSYEKGRPIHFTLNLEENLAELLRGLRMGGELTREIEQRAEQPKNRN